jgi:hypothetical protein
VKLDAHFDAARVRRAVNLLGGAEDSRYGWAQPHARIFSECASLMEGWEPGARDPWRRGCSGRDTWAGYVGGHVSCMRFDIACRLAEQGFDRQTPAAIIQTGKPFQTPGCAGCQNDVSACKPSLRRFHPADILSFPFALDAGDVVRVQRQRQSENICAHEECGVVSISAVFSPNALLEITNIH